MNCPKCGDVEMSAQTFDEVTIDRCAKCSGIWFDRLELEKLLEADPRALLAEDRGFQPAPDDAGPPIECPRCQGAPLIKRINPLRPRIIIDSCTACHGAWLDAGELAQIARADLPEQVRSLFGM